MGACESSSSGLYVFKSPRMIAVPMFPIPIKPIFAISILPPVLYSLLSLICSRPIFAHIAKASAAQRLLNFLLKKPLPYRFSLHSNGFILFRVIGNSGLADHVDFDLSRILQLSSIFLDISLARRTISSSLICSGTTIMRTSRPAWIAKDLSTPLKEFVISSSCFKRFVYVSNVSLLAPGLAAEIVSAA